MRRTLACGFALASLLCAGTVRAQQSLEVFLEAAVRYEPNLRAEEEDEAAAGSRIDEARARLLPSLTAMAAYQRNETQVVVQRSMADGTTATATILPYDQLSASVQFDVPLLDLPAFSELAASEHDARASALARRDALARLRISVIAAYYRLAAARAILEASDEHLRVAEQAREYARARNEADVAPALEVARAEVELGLVREEQVRARLEERLATRALVALTGLTPTPGAVDVDVADRVPTLEQALERVPHVPLVEAARARARAAGARQDGAWRTLLPSLRGFALERYTNAAGFQPESLWSAGVSLLVRFDFSMPASISTTRHVANASAARAEAAEVAVITAVTEAHSRIEAGRARVQAADEALVASDRALRDSRERYQAARATQLDVMIAERDHFDARVARALGAAEFESARRTLSTLLELEDAPR